MARWPVVLLLIYYCTPNLVSLLIQNLYSICDLMIVGHGDDGANAMAGIALYYPIESFLMSISLGLGVGLSILMSIAVGEGKPDKASRIAGNTLLIVAGIAIFFPLCTFFSLNAFFGHTGGTDASIPHGRRYGHVLLPAIAMQLAISIFDNMLRVDGKPVVATVLVCSSCAVNIGIDLVTIFIFQWGTVGCAIATVCANTIPTVIPLTYYLFFKKDGIRLTKAAFIPDFSLMKGVIVGGLGSFVAQIGFAVIMLAKNVFIGRLVTGTDAPTFLAAVQIVERFIIFTLVGLSAMCMGQIPVTGFAFGASRYGRAVQCFVWVTLAATVNTTGAFILMVICPRVYFSFFSSDPAVYNIVTIISRIEGAGIICAGFSYATTTFFLAVGQPWVNTTLMVARQFLVALPLMTLGAVFGKHYYWVQAANPVTDVVVALGAVGLGLVGGYRMYRVRARQGKAVG